MQASWLVGSRSTRPRTADRSTTDASPRVIAHQALNLASNIQIVRCVRVVRERDDLACHGRI